jgi:proteasome lid subunit RPN8/RPN11
VHDLVISRSQLILMDRHATSCRPEECCGLMLGKRTGTTSTVHEIVASPNVHDGDRSRYFAIAPPLLAETLHQERSQGAKLLGFFHSHPTSGPIPSARDEALAWPDLSYLILGHLGHLEEEAWQAKSWRWVEDHQGLVEESLTVVPKVQVP